MNEELKQVDKVTDFLINPDLWVKIGSICIKILLIIVVSRVLVTLSRAAINRIFRNREGGKLQIDQRRLETLRVLVNNVSRWVLFFLTVLLVLDQLGFDLRPVLVSAGVLGLAIGFGAQSLVRDIITGFFIIFEDQFAVGDAVTINAFSGTVMEIGLRITKLKSGTGEVHIIPNGTITQVTNFSLQNTVALVDVAVAYEENLDRVQEIIAEVAKKVKEENENIVSDPQVLGVQSLGPAEVVIRVTAECKPNTHYGVARQLRASIKSEFTARGIEVPYPRMIAMPNAKERA
ncbi:mechanosensitive ion channel family protein [Brevibacillus fluminis]|uniref:Mechanosensitive ion channel family protein n=1 Tax=Brevibacillus fluminis TaxID=511487 RepID=A0A3M8D833_9BACL|nr:mechanosensitive ion channel family protein [Brevibacillus fluminis]RNB83425.1 mechanosensitive ion channel family protein [Brevibacillus fluminis]